MPSNLFKPTEMIPTVRVTLAGVFDKYRLFTEKSNREHLSSNKNIIEIYPQGENVRAYNVSLGDLLFEHLGYKSYADRETANALNKGDPQHPRVTSSLCGAQIDRKKLNDTPSCLNEQTRRLLALENCLRFAGVSFVHYNYDGTRQKQTTDVTIQTWGPTPMFNNSPYTVEAGQMLMWVLPKPGDKQYAKKGLEAEDGKRIRAYTVPVDNVSGLRIREMVNWALTKKPQVGEFTDFLTFMKVEIRKDDLTMPVARILADFLQAEQFNLSFLKPFEWHVRLIFEYLVALNKTNPSDIEKLEAGADLYLAAQRRHNFVLNRKIFGRVVRGGGPGHPIDVLLI